MKTLLIPCLFMLLTSISFTSCVVARTPAPHDNGRHTGWHKNPNNPHHPATTNPGHTKAPGKGKPNK